MILTPDERRALFALGALLLAGQILASVQRHRESAPDRELAAWLDSLTAAGAPFPDTSAAIAEHEADSPPHPETRSALAGGQTRPKAQVRPREEIPPGILETGRLRINDASAAELEMLPGVGPAMAQRILEERARGPFRRAADLRRVKGIGPAKLAKIAPAVDFGPFSPDSARPPR